MSNNNITMDLMTETLAEKSASSRDDDLFTRPNPVFEDQPAWFEELRQRGWARFQELPMPARTDETWRFSKLKELDFDGFHPAEACSEAEVADCIERSRSSATPVARLVFVNDRLVHHDPVAGEWREKGVVIMSLSEAIREHSGLVREHFMQREAHLGSGKFAALHQANAGAGLFVHVPKGVELPGLVEVFHWSGGEGATTFPHTLIVADRHSKVRVVDHYLSIDEQAPAWVIGVNDLVSGEGAKVGYAALQRMNPVSKGIFINATTVERDSEATSFILNTGGSWVRDENVSHVEGQGARSNMLSLSLPGNSQQYDQRTYQLHKAAHTTSDLLYKNALADKSRTIFSGLIIVDAGAHFTDAYQTCRNLLLSDDVEAHALPGLEIKADQVKCSHGATTAPIGNEDLFYFLARGIPARIARKLITLGFATEVMRRLGDEELEKLIAGYVTEKLDRVFS